MKDFDYSNLMEKVIVITGASSGIGAALAEQLASDGAAVVLAARREDALQTVADRCGGNTLPVVTDVTRRDEVTRLVQRALDRFDRIDVWVNNAGQGLSRMPTELTDDDIDDMMRANVKSAIYGMQAVLPHFIARGSGQIINISSMLGRIPSALARSAYSASKHYLNALTAMFREEVQQQHPGIQFSLVSPGVVYTDFGLNARYGGVDSRNIPGGQIPEEVAAVIAGVIESRRPDVYTRPGARQQVIDYYTTIGVDGA
jgi:NADP-dependent 3-hydroxy acid dehydrogenase YdfG